MAHGLGGTREMRLYVFVERFAAADYACFLFDYRNYGASDGKWDATALSVIENAGLKDEYLSKIPEDISDAPDQRGEFDTPDCKCGCHKSGFAGFMDNIANAFRKLFKTKQICDCGRYHY